MQNKQPHPNSQWFSRKSSKSLFTASRSLNKLKILLTGGHGHATAYALIKELKKQQEGLDLYWVGPKSLVEGKVVVGIEEQKFVKMGMKVKQINAGKIQVKFTRFTLLSMLKIPLGFLDAFLFLLKVRPNIVVSFGGFVGMPVVFSAWLMGIPVILHEQTTVAGRANLQSVKFAKKIAISRSTSKVYYPSSKIVLTGNPIDEQILKVHKKTLTDKKPTVFITGGHTGSMVLNDIVKTALSKLLENYKVIHQVGSSQYGEFLEIKKKLKQNSSNYVVYDNVDPEKWPDVLSISDVVVSRAGANSTSQFIALKIPCLLIPITHTYMNEQEENANFALNYGVARKLNEDALTVDSFIHEINWLYKNRLEIQKKLANKISPDLHAATKFAKLILDEARN